MHIEGRIVRLRAVEPDDVETMYAWENDPRVWRVSGTLAPFSRHMLSRFVEEQQFDIYQMAQPSVSFFSSFRLFPCSSTM